jgi:hypothetical protein
MSGKPVKPPATKNRLAAVGFVIQASAKRGMKMVTQLCRKNNRKCIQTTLSLSWMDYRFLKIVRIRNAPFSHGKAEQIFQLEASPVW